MQNTYELINAGDIAGFGDLVADDFIEHQGGPGFPATKEGMHDFFPDPRMNVEDLIADGDETVARARIKGAHRGNFMGVSPTGSSVDVQLTDRRRVARACRARSVAAGGRGAGASLDRGMSSLLDRDTIEDRMDVEIMPVIEPRSAMANHGEVVAALVATAQPSG